MKVMWQSKILISSQLTTFFEWDAKEGGQSLKVLPNVINWFERAEEAVL